MGDFVAIYFASPSVIEQMQHISPEDMQAGMEAWKAWADRCGDALTYPGSALMGGLRLTQTGSSPGKGDVIGYSVLQTDDMEAAAALVADHPHLGWGEGCEIEVYQAMRMPI